MKTLAIVLLLIIAAGVGYLAYSEYQKRQFVAEVAERIVNPHGLEDAERSGNMIFQSFGYMAPIKTAVTEVYENTGRLPTSLLDAKYKMDPESLPSHIEDIVVAGNGEIITTFDVSELGLSGVIEVAVLKLTPHVDDQGLYWSCSANPQLNKYPELLTSVCRP